MPAKQYVPWLQSNWIFRLRQEFKDLLELLLLPGLAIFLPWSLCFRLYRLLSHSSWLYSPQTSQALAGAQSITLVEDSARWSADYRLVQLVNHADLYLSGFRSDRWMEKYIDIMKPGWPKLSTPFLAITFHWGTGLWSLRYLRSQNVATAFLSMRFDKSTFASRLISYYYARLRLREVERIGRARVIYKGGSVLQMQKALHQGTSVLGLIDVPPGEVGSCLPVRLFGRQAWFPRGLVRLAVDGRFPVVGFTLGLNRRTGQRILTVKGPLPNHDEQTLVNALSDLFTESLSVDPAAWHFWPFVASFLQCKEDTGRPGSTNTQTPRQTLKEHG